MQSGKGLVQKGSKYSSHQEAALDPISHSKGMEEQRGGAKKVDMVDSYFAMGVTSAAVTSVEHPGLDTSRRISLAGGVNRDTARVVSVSEADSDGNDQDNFDNGLLTTRSIAPPEMPGLSLITWDEFIEQPSMFYKLFSLDKKEFIHFDSSIVANFFHDSRMDPPSLGGPSGDGMSWTIFVDSYNQLQEVREFLTSRISVLLVDLVKPHGGGTAACLLAINAHDDHIRRVLHLTLSRAMQTMMADRCFSIEIDLNQSVEGWCRAVLQSDCTVHGGRIVITNGDAPENCCEIDDPRHCVVCFPMWAFRRIKYTILRRRHYDDTRLEFESSSIVLCTKSDKLRKSSGKSKP
ncbi:hypothetical protein PoB_000155200 [Plakobranchus ocellatus]|uniref:Uncharacterized protein n=1 Tax=Plakobranchus ocellatus TaxID=259542 RepID=A0AAV3XX57_9GAST|nr:hypothetical protein PoB_000155200 [Plakobranchus ocellatus]